MVFCQPSSLISGLKWYVIGDDSNDDDDNGDDDYDKSNMLTFYSFTLGVLIIAASVGGPRHVERCLTPGQV